MIREAAGAEGRISVGRIYENARKSGPGVLGGLSRRVNGIWEKMQGKELVKLGVELPLQPLRLGRFSKRVTHYAVPKELTRLLADGMMGTK